MDWCLYGDDKRKEMDRDLKPEYLLDDLRRYQDVFGEEFGVVAQYIQAFAYEPVVADIVSARQFFDFTPVACECYIDIP